jgi:hypothetical protein
MNAVGAPVVPLLVTQVNSEAALGIPPRRFRELVRALRLPTIEIGKLRGVEASVLLDALRARASKPEASETNRERLRRIAGLT